MKRILYTLLFLSSFVCISHLLYSSSYMLDMVKIPLNTLFDNLLILGQLVKIVLLLVGVAYYTLAERKIMGATQRRRGPNVVGIWGLLQPLADALKLISKEFLRPAHASQLIFLLAPVTMFILSLLSWSFITFLERKDWLLSSIAGFTLDSTASISNVGILILLALSSLNVYSIIIAGWSSNSKYAFLGSLRSAAQMISYEVSISLVILPVLLLAGSLDLVEIVLAQARTCWFWAPLLPLASIFFVSMLAETNRTPFDLPEAEAELVAGYNVEYSSIVFSLFFLAEYANMLLMSALASFLFFGGWVGIYFPLKVVMFAFFFIWVRATFPRYRYDQLMDLGWKVFLPIATALVFVVAALLLTFSAAPKLLIFSSLIQFDIVFNACLIITPFVFLNSRPLYALFALVGVFLIIVTCFMSLGIEFLSFLALIVYVGAVIMLFLFAIMMLNLTASLNLQPFSYYALTIVLLFIGNLISHVKYYTFCVALSKPLADLKQVGATLYTSYSPLLALVTAILISSLVITVGLAKMTTINSRHNF